MFLRKLMNEKMSSSERECKTVLVVGFPDVPLSGLVCGVIVWRVSKLVCGVDVVVFLESAGKDLCWRGKARLLLALSTQLLQRFGN